MVKLPRRILPERDVVRPDAGRREIDPHVVHRELEVRRVGRVRSVGEMHADLASHVLHESHGQRRITRAIGLDEVQPLLCVVAALVPSSERKILRGAAAFRWYSGKHHCRRMSTCCQWMSRAPVEHDRVTRGVLDDVPIGTRARARLGNCQRPYVPRLELYDVARTRTVRPADDEIWMIPGPDTALGRSAVRRGAVAVDRAARVHRPGRCRRERCPEQRDE